MSFFKMHNEYEEFVKTTFQKHIKIKEENGVTEIISYKNLKVPLVITNVGSGVSFLLLSEN